MGNNVSESLERSVITMSYNIHGSLVLWFKGILEGWCIESERNNKQWRLTMLVSVNKTKQILLFNHHKLNIIYQNFHSGSDDVAYILGSGLS